MDLTLKLLNLVLATDFKHMDKFKTFFYLLFFSTIIISCDDENAGDCFQTEGNIIQKEMNTNPFEEIIVNQNVELYIIDSEENKIIIEGGENLIDDIHTNITNNILEITNNNTCFFDRDFETIKVFVYTNNISRIRNSSNLPVYSIGVLNYPSLELISENYLSDYLNSGDFNLELNTTTLNIVANGPSNYTLSGSTDNININFAGANPRFEGEGFIIENAFIFARSTNDIIINVINEVNGNLFSTGDVVLLSPPNSVNLNAHYTGRVITDY